MSEVKLPNFQYESPKSLEDAVALLAASDGAGKIISGGQSLVPMMAYRLVAPELLIDLKNVPGLDRIEIEDGICLGARVTWAAIEQDARLNAAHPLLQEAVRHIAHYQIRNRGTVGGSLAHADPAAEFPAVALSCGAAIHVMGSNGPRIIPAHAFFFGPLVTALDEDEIITRIVFPAWPEGRRFGFKEYARRQGDFALAGATVHFDIAPDGRIANPSAVAFGLADTAVRLTETEAFLDGRKPTPEVFRAAAEAGAEAVEVHADIQGDAFYRRALLKTMIARALTMAAVD
ncbi:FAD binding domain-containing protein [Mesorhizobium sp. A556]